MLFLVSVVVFTSLYKGSYRACKMSPALTNNTNFRIPDAKFRVPVQGLVEGLGIRARVGFVLYCLLMIPNMTYVSV